MKREIKMEFDEATNEMVNPQTGERFSINYDLQSKFIEEVEPQVIALKDKCAELQLPMTCHVQFLREDEKVGQNHCNYFPGKRTTPQMRVAADITEGNVPASIIALLAISIAANN